MSFCSDERASVRQRDSAKLGPASRTGSGDAESPDWIFRSGGPAIEDSGLVADNPGTFAGSHQAGTPLAQTVIAMCKPSRRKPKRNMILVPGASSFRAGTAQCLPLTCVEHTRLTG